MTKKHQILALHGFTGCGADFSGFSELCLHAGAWHCPDLPGHGRNAGGACSPEATLQWVQAESTGANILLGYSMGARAALLHATRFPEKWSALILVSGNPGIEDKLERAARRRSDEQLAARIEREGIAAFLKHWEQTPLIKSQQSIRPDWRARMQANRHQQQPAGLAASLRQFGQGSCPNLWPRLMRLSMPVLLITGAADSKYSAIARRMSELLKQAGNHSVEQVALPGCSHMPHLESPESCSTLIDGFLSSLATGYPASSDLSRRDGGNS